MRKLNPIQWGLLRLMTQGACYYHDAAKAGANGATLAMLVRHGLAVKNGHKWEITPKGRTAYKSDKYEPSKEGE